MEKKWWYLVVTCLILAAAVFFTADFLSKENIQIIQGRVVISGPGEYQFPSSGDGDVGESDDGQDAFVEEEPASGTTESAPLSNLSCWECSFGGFILNVHIENLTDQIVQESTNCTNVTQLVEMDCPTSTAEQTCGNGICESSETSESCSQDCVVVSGEITDSEESSEAESAEEEIVSEAGNEEPEIEFYYRWNYDRTRCVGLIQERGGEKKESNCVPNIKDSSENSAPEKPAFNPADDSFLKYFLRMMFGLP